MYEKNQLKLSWFLFYFESLLILISAIILRIDEKLKNTERHNNKTKHIIKTISCAVLHHCADD